MKVLRFVLFLFLGISLSTIVSAAAPDVILNVRSEVHLSLDESVTVEFGFDPTSVPGDRVQAWSSGICYDPGILDLRVRQPSHVQSHCVGCEPPQTVVEYHDTGIAIAEVYSSAPSSGLPTSRLSSIMELEIVPKTKGSTTLTICNSLGSPPVSSSLVVDGELVDIPEQDVLTVFVENPSPFVRGDANSDGIVNIADATFILSYLFTKGEVPKCFNAADVNDDGKVNISDPVFLLGFLFSAGPTIPAPFPDLGEDGTPDDLSCERGG